MIIVILKVPKHKNELFVLESDLLFILLYFEAVKIKSTIFLKYFVFLKIVIYEYQAQNNRNHSKYLNKSPQ